MGGGRGAAGVELEEGVGGEEGGEVAELEDDGVELLAEGEVAGSCVRSEEAGDRGEVESHRGSGFISWRVAEMRNK